MPPGHSRQRGDPSAARQRRVGGCGSALVKLAVTCDKLRRFPPTSDLGLLEPAIHPSIGQPTLPPPELVIKILVEV